MKHNQKVSTQTAGTIAMGVTSETGQAKQISVTETGDRDALDIVLYDDSGNQITTFGGGTQYTEGDTDATLTGTVAMAEGPSDTATPLQVDASKHLQVDIAADSVGIGGGTQYTEGDIDTTITGTAVLGEVSNELRPIQLDNSDYLYVNIGDTSTVVDVNINNAAVEVTNDTGDPLAVQGTVNARIEGTYDGASTERPYIYDLDTGVGNEYVLGASLRAEAAGGSEAIPGDGTDGLLVNLGNNNDVIQSTHDNLNANVNLQVGDTDVANGNPVPVSDAGGSLTVDGTVAVSSVTPGTSASSLGKAEDAAHSSGDVGVMMLGVRNNGNSTLSGTNLDYTPLGVDEEGSPRIVGNRAHDAVDSGNPVLIGGRATDWDPDTDAEQGPTEVAAADRDRLTTDRQGCIVERVNARYHAPTNVSTTYDNTTTTATSGSIECFKYRHAAISYSISAANTPTDIQIFVEVSLDGTNFVVLTNDALGSLIYTDTNVSGGIDEAYQFPIAAQDIRIRIVATGTSASNTFTVSNFNIYLRN